MSELVKARTIDLGDTIVGLGRVQTINDSGGGSTSRMLTLHGEWGWRLSLPFFGSELLVERKESA